MHISEGVLSAPVLAAGAAVALAGTAVGLRKLDLEDVAQAGMLSAAFFVASLIHVPIGPSSVHLILNGLVGLLLGWSAFPAILTALILQAMLFHFGGITTLGVNTVVMALPAVACYLLFGRLVRKSNGVALAAAFACGAGAVFLGGLLAGAVLVLTGEAFIEVAALVVAAHIPVMVIEGVVTAFCVVFLKKVKPEMLPG
jgi:cobalt/nickel transport system permease protein